MKSEEVLIPALAGMVGITSPGDVGLIVACAAGVYASAAWSKKIESRKEMFNIYLACLIMGLAFTVVVNAVVGFAFEGFSLTQGVRSSLGAIVSCLTRFWLPSLIDALKSGDWKNWVPFINRGRS